MKALFPVFMILSVLAFGVAIFFGVSVVLNFL